jgi:hypothetical protein
MNLCKSIGYDPASRSAIINDKNELIEFINLKLSAMGCSIYGDIADYPFLSMGQSLIAHYQAKDRFRDYVLPPADTRIMDFLKTYLQDVAGTEKIRLPAKTFNLSQHGLARELSIPPNRDYFQSEIIESYRVDQGVLHNPKNDRRTTQGVFHVAEGGLPVPADKKSVPKAVFARLLEKAFQPPESLMELPFTSAQDNHARCWVSLLLRPVICPEVPGFIPEKSMEVRFFAPGNLVSNLDFVESIFGNAGDPFLLENDAGLDVEHWSGHTGCIILAPHLVSLKKKTLGLPHISEATDRQKRDGMCWENPDEYYNDGGAFKITARDKRGIIVTVIADNYFGYCKKEVKTQISYAANLYGMCEEEHAGGALSFACFDLGEEFRLKTKEFATDHTFAEVIERQSDAILLQPEGYAIDREWPEICYVPEDAHFSLLDQRITWKQGEVTASIKLLAGKIYILPCGYKVQMVKPHEARRWRLIGTNPEAMLCHKPCTVSGGGKSEISKSIADAIIHESFYVNNLNEDLNTASSVIAHEFGNRFKDPRRNREQGRPILSRARSLGSVIKLLSPSDEYTDEHNAYIQSIPAEIKELVFLIKRFYREEWGNNWHDRFSVDIINGVPGHELKYRDSKVITSYLRLGYDSNGSWRVFGLRKDFFPAAKIQVEDDITASVIVPCKAISGLPQNTANTSVKFVQNCEYRLFQRPDDAIVRGYDKQTELDMSRHGNFFSNYQPLTRQEAREMIDDAIRFDFFTEPMKKRIRDFVESPDGRPDYVVCSANPRLVDGKPTKNPRYLQTRTSLEKPIARYIADIGTRLFRRLNKNAAVHFPVNAVLPGHRNNPPQPGVRSLAVFNPIHYMELPEFFMECISSMTGKSPSTTGAGSEGALTKGPFNALLPIHDLNNALVSFIVTGYQPFITAAGCVGPKFRVDHDISLLVPEIWCRMKDDERDPKWLIQNGFLEKCQDIEYNGKLIQSSILGYRITQDFVNHFMGRVFSNPSALFTEEMLRPELQDMEIFNDGMENMIGTHAHTAENYFLDGSIDRACPPLKALLHIMRDGEYKGLTLDSPDFRKLFTYETVMVSDWYLARLYSRRESNLKKWEKHLDYLNNYPIAIPELAAKKQIVQTNLSSFNDPSYISGITGSIGCDTIY